MNNKKIFLLLLFSVLGAYLLFFFIDYPLLSYLKEFSSNKENLSNKELFLWLLYFNFLAHFSFLGSGGFALFILISFLSYSWTRYCKDKKKWIKKLKLIFYSLLIGGILVRILKITIGRYRPLYFLETEVAGFDSFRLEYEFSSFPSGHTQTAFTLMFYLACFYPKYKVGFYFLAILAGLSRIFLFQHYPSDVLIGAYIGFVCFFWTNKYLEKKQIFRR